MPANYTSDVYNSGFVFVPTMEKNEASGQLSPLSVTGTAYALAEAPAQNLPLWDVRKLYEGYADKLQLAVEDEPENDSPAIAYTPARQITVRNRDELKQAVATHKAGRVIKIALHGDDFTDADLALLAQLETLKDVDLSDCWRIGNAGLASLRNLKLERLDLSRCWRITSDALEVLQEMPLQYLNLSSCHQLDDSVLLHLQGMPLAHLNLSGCWRITNDGLARLQGLPLRHLNLARCRQIDGTGLAHLRTLPLRDLDLSVCWRVDDAALVHLQTLPLAHLGVAKCTLLSPITLGAWKKRLGQGLLA